MKMDRKKITSTINGVFIAACFCFLVTGCVERNISPSTSEIDASPSMGGAIAYDRANDIADEQFGYGDNDESYSSYSGYIRDGNDYYPLYKYGKGGKIIQPDNSRGVYEPFATDNTIPFQDNEDSYWYDSYLYEY